jgi:acyl carrier protein
MDPKRVSACEELMSTVLGLVARTIGDKRARIEPDTALFSSVEMFDSFALLELVLRLESTFELTIPDDDLDRDAFSSPRAIAAYLCGRLVPHSH